MSGFPGPEIYPAAIDADDGSINLTQVKVFLTYDETTGDLTHIAAYGPDLSLVLDEAATGIVAGAQPRMVSGRHRVTLADGRLLFIRALGGCGCGNRGLKSYRPGGLPATSGYRP